MPVYEYECKTCVVIFQRYRKISEYEEESTCPECGRELGRKFSFSTKRSFEPHYNTAVGKFVSNKTQLNDQLRKLEDKAYQQTGYAPNYQVVDPSEAALGVTDEGMDATHRQNVAQKKLEVRKWL